MLKTSASLLQVKVEAKIERMQIPPLTLTSTLTFSVSLAAAALNGLLV